MASPQDETDGRTAAAPDRQQASIRVVAATLEVRSGPDAGKSARFDAPSFVIGQSESADLRLTDKTVSREHVRLTLDEKGIRLRDDASRNGTWIGGARVKEALLTTDTTIVAGGSTIAIRLDGGPSDIAVSTRTALGGAIGVSSAMRHVFAFLERAARSDITVLLEGESGVGKDVLAHAVHAESPRRDGPFVAVDCGAIPPTLIEAELFGHVRGAFTGATASRAGLVAQANGGTLFLDEIGELPIDLQPKLLRVLENREVRAVGATGPADKVDVRLVVATNRRLLDAVKDGAFRKDLFYRLAVARIVIPPLRDRPEDILPIATSFLRATRGPTAELPDDLAVLLGGHSWPGNVRELRNVIDRFALLGVREASGLFDGTVGPATRDAPPAEDLSLLPLHEARRRALDRFEESYLPRVLERAGGVVARAAEMAGVARPSFYRMLERVRGKQEPGSSDGSNDGGEPA